MTHCDILGGLLQRHLNAESDRVTHLVDAHVVRCSASASAAQTRHLDEFVGTSHQLEGAREEFPLKIGSQPVAVHLFTTDFDEFAQLCDLVSCEELRLVDEDMTGCL